MGTSAVPDIVVGRLPLYLRALSQMESEGKEITSSQELGEKLGISSAQIRKDLSQFGEFGKQGTGYGIGYLTEQLKRILRVNQNWDVALVGVGDLGRAVANYAGFLDRGFRVVAIYDNDPRKIGLKVGPFVIRDAAKLAQDLREQRIRVAMLAVPVDEAQSVTDRLVEGGVRAILCYAPTSISIPRSVRVQYIDPVLHLQRMTYYIP
ncbi:MAG TPA: redox-sensing transcriptional repressor Rex [Anaerolineales bacterium]|nr:redox-sensing transcriptional repressor Rex [Anaerolineales bacterium]